MTLDMVTIPREEYEQLKREAQIDTDLLQQLMNSFKDIKEGKVRRVR